MAELTRRIWGFWGAHWSIDGALEKVREACKYPFKPADLKRMDGGDLRDLDDALFGLHLVQPLGELREQIRARREACLTVKREYRVERDVNGQRFEALIPVVLPDWNARKKNRLPDAEKKRQTERRKAARLDYLNRCAASRLTAETATVNGTVQMRLFEANRTVETVSGTVPEETEIPIKPPRINRILARLSPAPYFDRVCSPALLVHGYDGNLSALLAVPCVQAMVDAIRAQVTAARGLLADARRAADFARDSMSVHTYPVTVRAWTDYLPKFCNSEAWRPLKLAEMAENLC